MTGREKYLQVVYGKSPYGIVVVFYEEGTGRSVASFVASNN